MWFNDNISYAYDYKPSAVEETTRYQDSNKAFTYLWDNYFTFDHTFKGKHSLNVMAGTSAQWNDASGINATKAGFLFSNVHEFDNGTVNKSIGGASSDWAMMSFMARLNYSYDDGSFSQPRCAATVPQDSVQATDGVTFRQPRRPGDCPRRIGSLRIFLSTT